MIRIRDIALPPANQENQLIYEAARILKVSPSAIRKLTIFRKSVDARKKPDVKLIYTVDVTVNGSDQKIVKGSRNNRASVVSPIFYRPLKCESKPEHRPVIVGFGPAGMFAGLVLALAGLNPLILERGEDAQTRHDKVSEFWKTGKLDPKSNVQFGEGGAGTFSDGKLNTGVNNPRIGWILEQFVAAGAHENILYDAKPHVGTDILLNVVQNIRKRIISLGGEVRFNSQVTDFEINNHRICGLTINDCERISCSNVILAVGHSARDTFAMLLERRIPMEPKPFSMGVRIEHKQSLIDRSQYGTNDLPLPAADYKLVRHLDDETVYTFCMCPGGYVVAAASEEGGVVTNGMSYSGRSGENANSALLVTLNPVDFPYDGVLGGVKWQRELEQKAFSLSGSYRAPAQTVGDFLAGKASTCAAGVIPTYKPGVTWCDLHEVLPDKITCALTKAIPQMDGFLKGFADPNAVLTAPETRSSSPVRILRGEDRCSSIRGLYPCGEGAGYAGGIMSAAIDGMMCAESLIHSLEVEK